MKKLIACALLICFQHFSTSQEKEGNSQKIEIDTTLLSLEHQLDTADNDSLKAQALFDLGVHHWSTDAVRSEQYLNESADLLTSQNSINHRLLGDVYKYLAALLTEKGQFVKAMRIYIQAREQLEKVNDSLGIANLYHNMSLLHGFQNELKEERKFLRKAIAINKAYNAEVGLAHDYKALGNSYALGNTNSQEESDSALVYFEKSRVIFERLKDTLGFMRLDGNVADFYLQQAKYDESIVLFKKCLAIAEKNNIPVFQIIYQSKLASAYLESKDYQNARISCKKSLDMAIDNDIKQWISKGYQKQSEIYKAIGNYRAAYESSRLYKIYSDSLYNKDNIKKIQELELTYNFKKEKLRDSLLLVNERELAESQVEILQSRNKIQFQWMLLIAILLLGAGAFYYFNSRKNKHKAIIEQNKRSMAEMENDILNKEIEYKRKDVKHLAIDIAQNKEWAMVLAEKLAKVRLATGKKRTNELKSLEDEIKKKIYVDKSTDLLHEEIEKLGSSFFEKLKGEYPDLTKTDVRLCALIRMNMDTKQIAMLQNINPSSVKMSRNRLRKKLNLIPEDNLNVFLESY
ncbi:transcriptional regulator [Winogradskyella sp.]|uniref:transcriptional regulator n=1 Tax=Winogradskyella sp. TaxID=1883156 RepID=UPI003BACCAD8